MALFNVSSQERFCHVWMVDRALLTQGRLLPSYSEALVSQIVDAAWGKTETQKMHQHEQVISARVHTRYNVRLRSTTDFDGNRIARGLNLSAMHESTRLTEARTLRRCRGAVFQEA